MISSFSQLDDSGSQKWKLSDRFRGRYGFRATILNWLKWIRGPKQVCCGMRIKRDIHTEGTTNRVLYWRPMRDYRDRLVDKSTYCSSRRVRFPSSTPGSLQSPVTSVLGGSMPVASVGISTCVHIQIIRNNFKIRKVSNC